jgi:predicted RNase H-like nuclease (RuvC/YqgF family)
MALWELFKKGSEEGLEALRDGVTVFMTEAGRRGRILKKKVEITSLQNDVRRYSIELGSLVYDFHARGKEDVFQNEEVQSLLRRIDESKARMRMIEAEIEGIKKEEEGEKGIRERARGKPEEKGSPPSAPSDRAA